MRLDTQCTHHNYITPIYIGMDYADNMIIEYSTNTCYKAQLTLHDNDIELLTTFLHDCIINRFSNKYVRKFVIYLLTKWVYYAR